MNILIFYEIFGETKVLAKVKPFLENVDDFLQKDGLKSLVLQGIWPKNANKAKI